ncbi:putative Ubiquitin-like modifier-activating enzyme 1 C (Uba1C) [Monocercomonoides exilis]|uniref:putative Ubiquitin-like modifier-activating enzyme 1 C (Uba1C) n=1 Tax=Monocercomonoides exilis TaxID=2049356 RepID=UPI00355AA957|nr:putative Ubiquitin-like modifier-activating enzyme 1 C (Uba1C) [Monocercomonoides exilis]|eukprot:MONOS_3107.1-p1 / transcript=MONOS_3107.1 / gene=MONOS_3107 / organism=Monocercomonoides_exilis_PA203 / gene_product=Ubiquitin-like modifier-activating enzyme 1 C (Uba1C) / transcript_product=Ubiquitin-like modifier-activating enzyme 1 C (Uba1C) / location=Mono_scaffold00070:46222-49795(+) / protein_length=1101 / sequence_SO=supercontig / SO=protein_coding / is_pseudo=false
MEDQEELARYDRQIHTFGLDAMKKISHSSVIISGMNGTGVEIAKNVILSGVRVVAIHDTSLTQLTDLSSQFYLSESDVGKNRAQCCLHKLAELNEYVHVQAFTSQLDSTLIKKYKVVVMVNAALDELVRVSTICRENSVKFISVDQAGLFGRIFVDCGDDHEVTDSDGERCQIVVVGGISKEKKARISMPEGETHPYADGDYVQFSLVEGMTEINNLPPAKVERISPKAFYVEIDTTEFHEYTGNGYITQVKVPTHIKNRSLVDELKEKPTLHPVEDFLHPERPKSFFAGFCALAEFAKRHNGRYPLPHNKEESEEVANEAERLHKRYFPSLYEESSSSSSSSSSAVASSSDSNTSSNDVFEKSLITLLARVSSGNFSPTCACLGGIVGQEVMKAVTNKLTPLNQWLFVENSQCLGYGVNGITDLDKLDLPSEADAAPLNCRYDGQIRIFGRNLQKKLGKLRTFLVGSGAVGCETLKNWAMMGVGCNFENECKDPKSEDYGLITVTDMDNIEISNLSRQFLFRPWDIQKPKSLTAAKAIVQINNAVSIEPLVSKVGRETEKGPFDATFWKSLDFVGNALDNLPSRLYVDEQCVAYQKALFECGTLGTKGNTQSVIPFLTENYGNSQDEPDNEIAMCTVRNLPYLIEHTIEYARGIFVSVFTEEASDVAAYLRDPAGYLTRLSSSASKTSTIKKLVSNLITDRPKNFDDCIMWGRRLFERLFVNQIKQLLHNFPPDAKTTYGVPFWSGKNRMPTPTPFDPKNEMHVQFVGYAAFIRAMNYGVEVPSCSCTASSSSSSSSSSSNRHGACKLDWSYITNVASSTTVEQFVPTSDISLDVGDNTASNDGQEQSKTAQAAEEEEKCYKEAVAQLPTGKDLEKLNNELKVNGIDFEKDDDNNHHIDFISCCANLRAINYSIPTADRQHIKQISGKIIPAIATTTAVVSALTCFDMMSYVKGYKKIDAYRNWFVNLAIGIITYSEPMPAPKVGDEDENYTIWDRMVLSFDEIPTLGAVLERVSKEKALRITFVGYGAGILFNSAWKDEEKKNTALSTPIVKLVKEAMDENESLINSSLTIDTMGMSLSEPKKVITCPPVVVKYPPIK